MSKHYRIFCFVLLILQYQTVGGVPPLIMASAIGGIASALYNIGKGIVQGIVSLDRKLSDPAYRGPNIERPHDKLESNIMDQLQYLSKRRDRFKVDVEHFKNDIYSRIEETVPAIIELNQKLSQFFFKVIEIDNAYDNFLIYVNESDKYDKNLLLKFASDAIAENNCGIQYILNEIYTILIMDNFAVPSLVNSLKHHIEIFIKYLEASQSAQQFFYNILISVIYTELKGYIALNYSYRILHKYQHGNYENHLLKLEQDFAFRINTTIITFKNVMASISREIWKNNPVNHEEDKTYIELKHVFNAFIINEYELSKDALCSNTCKEYKKQVYPPTGNDCYYDLCKKQRACKGTLHDCIHAFDTKVNICLEENGDKRYRSLVVQPGIVYGSSLYCPSKSIQVNRHYASLTISWCDPCMCICDEHKAENSIRYFNLEPSISRFHDNYVMTGTRFVKHGNSIYLQIQEGQLLPNGYINESTIDWVPLKLNTTEVHKIQWEHSKQFILNDVEVPKDNVLVGLGFDSFFDQYPSKSLRLKVIYVSINFTSGLVLSKSYDEHVVETDGPEINIGHLAIPILSSDQEVQKSEPNRIISFTISSFFDDISQTTIPFIDIQPVVTDPPIPISGAGFYHKMAPGSAGFIALRLLTYNVEPHLLADISISNNVSIVRDTVDNKTIEKNIY